MKPMEMMFEESTSDLIHDVARRGACCVVPGFLLDNIKPQVEYLSNNESKGN